MNFRTDHTNRFSPFHVALRDKSTRLNVPVIHRFIVGRNTPNIKRLVNVLVRDRKVELRQCRSSLKRRTVFKDKTEVFVFNILRMFILNVRTVLSTKLPFPEADDQAGTTDPFQLSEHQMFCPAADRDNCDNGCDTDNNSERR